MTDDWQNETTEKLKRSAIYRALSEKCDAEPKKPQVIALVNEAAHYCYQRTKTTVRNMGEFTLHDGDHLFRVLTIMERLIGSELLGRLTIPELLLLNLSAFFHDIGMAPDEKTVVTWRKVWDSNPTHESQCDIDEFNKFSRFCAARPDKQVEIDTLITKGAITAADLLKDYLISEYIRQTHATRAKEIIEKDWNGKIRYCDIDLTVDFAEICYSHNEDAINLLDLDVELLCSPGIFACLPFIGVILRLSDVLDFDAKRTPEVLFSHLWVRNAVSLKEWEKHRAIEAWTIECDKIQFHAKCTHPAIEVSIREFCDLIDQELSTCRNILVEVNKRITNHESDRTLDFPFQVDRAKIEAKRDISRRPLYTYKKTQFNLSKTQVIDLLMGTKLYGNPEVALRELLQNSIDACLLRRSMESSWNNNYTPTISVRYYSEDDQDILEVIDNGTGMDQYIIDNYYSKVGVSFYKSTDFYDLRSQTDSDFEPNSRFGIGILSCFMVADSIEIDTRRVYGAHKSSDPLKVRIEGQESIFWITDGEREVPGTATRLYLRKAANPWERMNEDTFIKSVKSILPNPPFQITISTTSKEEIRDEKTFSQDDRESIINKEWKLPHPNIREIQLTLSNKETGIIGMVKIGILETHGKPVSVIDVNSKSVEIDGIEFQLDKKMTLNGKDIQLQTTSISIDEDGCVDSSPTSSVLAESRTQISLHGIEVPSDLFAPYWRRQKGKAHLNWPFPLLGILDVCSTRNLDLNSARTQILLGDRWDDFEETLAFIICKGIFETEAEAYRETLIAIWGEEKVSSNFKLGMERAIESLNEPGNQKGSNAKYKDLGKRHHHV